MELLSMLTSQLGISEEQAAGGTGMLMGLAKEKLGGDFSQISDAIPEVSEMIDQAPSSGGGLMGSIGGLAGGLGGGKVGNLLSLGSGFSKLGMDAGMITKFVPVILGFVKGKAGSGAMDMLSKVLK